MQRINKKNNGSVLTVSVSYTENVEGVQKKKGNKFNEQIRTFPKKV